MWEENLMTQAGVHSIEGIRKILAPNLESFNITFAIFVLNCDFLEFLLVKSSKNLARCGF